MKILLINSEFPPIGGGAGGASANLARQLVVQGHEVLVLTSRYASLPHSESWQGVRIERVAALRRRQDRSGLVEQVSFILAGSLAASPLLKTFQAEVVLAFFGVPSGPIAWLLRKRHGLPYLVSMRGGDVPGFRPYDFGTYHRLMAPFLRSIWREAGCLVANSNGLRDLALKFEPSACIELVPNGVDLQAFKPDVRAWSPPRLLSVGRLVHQKGFDLAARALAGMRELDWQWVIAGDGSFRPEFEILCRELGISERVHLPGWQSKEQLTQQYQRANLFVFPSRHEGMPNAVLEAMASGLPVVASRIAGNEELVVHNETGMLFQSESVTELQSCLKELIPEAGRRQLMGAAARTRVEAQFSWAGVAEQYSRLLVKMLEAD
jgi:glycosyltransferase involved in cell wall biosynthesis